VSSYMSIQQTDRNGRSNQSIDLAERCAIGKGGVGAVSRAECDGSGRARLLPSSADASPRDG